MHGTSRATSVCPVNAGTMTDTAASWIALTVSAHRSVSPNRSCSRRASSGEYLRLCGSILIWQRSATASTRPPRPSVTFSRNSSVGVAVYGAALAPVQSKISFAIYAPASGRARSRISARKSVSMLCASAPPSKPRQCSRKPPASE